MKILCGHIWRHILVMTEFWTKNELDTCSQVHRLGNIDAAKYYVSN